MNNCLNRDKTGMTRYVLILSCYGKNSVLYTSKGDKENKVVMFVLSFIHKTILYYFYTCMHSSDTVFALFPITNAVLV